MKILVTGANGFIGKRFMELAKSRFELIPLSLRNKNIAELNLQGADAIVHLAGKAHQINNEDEQVFFEVNYKLTQQLADRALVENIPHFVFISTLRVYGIEVNGILNETSPCLPVDAYGKSKLQTEQYLQSLDQLKMKVAIVRPPMVYGPEVQGNTLRLLNLCNKNLPLPFANTKNFRSVVFTDNMLELIITILQQQQSGIFLSADDKPVSTDAFLSLVKKHLNNKTPLLSLPGFLRNVLKRIRPDLYNSIYNSFIIDTAQTNKLLNFTPPHSTNEGVAKMAAWFKSLK